jgi:hypothetical protein
MATVNSNQMAKLLATPVQHINSDEHGRVRRAFFAFEPTVITGATDTVNLCKLPPGARVMSGKLFWEAGTATCQFAVGIAGSTGKYSAVPALLTAAPIIQVNTGGATGGCGGFDLCGAGTGGTIAAPVVGEVQASSITIIGTVSVAGAAANKRICGWMDYLGME